MTYRSLFERQESILKYFRRNIMMRTVKRISVALGSLATMTLLSNATYVAT